MVVTKEWDEVVEKIYNLIGINSLMDLELTIPSSLFTEYKPEYQVEKNERLSYLHILLKVTSFCSGEEETSIKTCYF